MVEDTVPEVGDRLIGEVEKLAPEVREISKPVGAETVIFAVKLEPDTVKDCCALAVLAHAEKALILLTEVVIMGDAV